MTPVEWALVFIAVALLVAYAGEITRWIQNRAWNSIKWDMSGQATE